MKTDTYTKVVLSVIAICLTVNLVKDYSWIPTAQASENPVPATSTTEYRLVPISESNTIDVRIVDIATYDELHVNLKNIDTYDEMKVNIKSIDTSDELDINIDEIGGSFVSNGGPIKVQLD